MAVYKKIFTNKAYAGTNGFNQMSLQAYLNTKGEMSAELKTKMTKAWTWEASVTFEQFT